MACRRPETFRTIFRLAQTQQQRYLFGSSREYSNAAFRGPRFGQMGSSSLFHSSQKTPILHGNAKILCSIMDTQSAVFLSRALSVKVKAPVQQNMPFTQYAEVSPEIVCEPYAPREPIPLWRRLFTRGGWQRTKDDMILQLKSASAIVELKKTGYSKKKFYTEAFDLYKKISTLLANGDRVSLRKHVTERMYSALKNEIKHRESVWHHVYWELTGPAVKIRTMQARQVEVDKRGSGKVFVQLTLEFLTKQKFEAYDSTGAVVAGDKNKEVLVRDIWVFEKSLFHPDAYWRLCGRINL